MMHAMLALTLLAFVPVAPAPPPSPTPTSSGEGALREIGRIRATTPLCRSLATHATVAAGIAIEEDRKIGFTIGTMRHIKLDENIIVKARGTDQLRRQYVAWRAGAVQGEAEMRKFREDTKLVTDPEQKAALVKFADALAGVLYRQKKLADDLGRYIAWLDAQEPLSDQERADLERSIMRNQSNLNAVHNPFGDINNMPETLDKSARRAADELEIRAVPIAVDEDDAAKRIDLAFKGC